MITKRDLARKLTLEEDYGYLPERVGRILGISVSQVVKLVLQERTWKEKPRKPERRKSWDKTQFDELAKVD